MTAPDSADDQKGEPGTGVSWAAAALFGLCPRCNARALFDGPVKFAPGCRSCGLDFARFNVGDGPAAFLIMIVGGLIVALAVWLELAVAPPWWVHVVLWAPLTTLLVLLGLRFAKAWLLRAEYRNAAREAGTTDL